MNVVRHTLSPELLNRIDETVCFNRLQREHMDTIAKIGLKDIESRLESELNMSLDVSPLALDCLASRGYDVRYGARPLKRTLAKDVLNPLSRLVLEGAVTDGDVVKVCTRGEALKSIEGFGFITSSPMGSTDKNDVVILRNHEINSQKNDEDDWDDDEFLLEDGVHHHR